MLPSIKIKQQKIEHILTGILNLTVARFRVKFKISNVLSIADLGTIMDAIINIIIVMTIYTSLI